MSVEQTIWPNLQRSWAGDRLTNAVTAAMVED